MTNLQKKFATAVATSALLLQILSPIAFADTTIQISGNGSSSNNTANVSVSNNTTVTQNNTANVNNTVNSNATTGGNDANDNTGGNVTVKTGNATSNTTVKNDLNKNVADVNNCNCEGNTTVNISGNGSNSKNKAKLDLDNNTSVFQDNYANVINDVNANAKTGGNDANRNTGGDVTINTGDANAEVTVDNAVNFNAAEAGCGCDITVLAKESGNGEDSKNKIEATLGDSLGVFQDNDGYLNNDADANAKTGKNDAKDNTGTVSGDAVEVSTGDATNSTKVSNSGNSNVFGSVPDLPTIHHISFSADFAAVWAAWIAFLGGSI